jgi:hypothetical protein
MDLEADPPPVSFDTRHANITTPLSTFHKLKALNPSIACDPDCIPTWVLKEYAEILPSPISEVLNSPFLSRVKTTKRLEKGECYTYSER